MLQSVSVAPAVPLLNVVGIGNFGKHPNKKIRAWVLG